MKKLFTLFVFFYLQHDSHAQTTARAIWSKETANQWYAGQPWLVGCNFIPSTAINELEMWQADSFDPKTIDRELGWAAALGMNTVRVYLHDLVWKEDAAGFTKRINTFLAIAAKHRIKPIFVLFDSCWDPFPKPGKQREPKPGVHNSGWVQSPGADALADRSQYARLEKYVKELVGHFAKDKRILGWDVWNEPDNTNNSSYGQVELKNKEAYVLPLLKQAFEWARSVNPGQPLTSAVWKGDWSSAVKLTAIEKVQLDESDIISFHNYDSAGSFEKRIEWLLPYGRPIICTEYMARGNGSYFKTTLPIAKRYKVGAYNWGLVDGKTQTKYAWDSWSKKYVGEPPLWFHEIFRTDGTPYRQEEVEFIKQVVKQPVVYPALNHDFPDPTVIRANGKYYAYATNTVVNGKYAHIQLAVSTDLVHWTYEGDALPSGSHWAGKDFWAPHVIYDAQSKKYILYYSARSKSDSVDMGIGVAFADKPEGPFIDAGQPVVTGKSFVNIDPFVMVDPKSRKKLFYWGSAHQPLKVQELSDDWKTFKAGSIPKVVLEPKPQNNYERLIEGAWVDYYNGYYYLYYSGENCCGPSANYAVLVARSKDPLGPFQRLEQTSVKGNSVILEKNASWFAPGHNSIVRDQKGKIYIAYHAIANSNRKGPRVFLLSPLAYKNGWPVVQY
jgi:hypothetical protein